MAKIKKEFRLFNFNMTKDTYESLEKFCETTGLQKSVVAERAIATYVQEVSKHPEKLMQYGKTV